MTAREKLDEIKAQWGLKTDEELAKKLDVTKVALDKWIVRGKIPDKIEFKTRLLSQNITGNNNIQVSGNKNDLNAQSTPSQYSKLFTLIEAYATPKLIEEFTVKLLKIKEVVDG